ncbi:MAG: cache domain-containing protein [Oscillospiraceae bacterium]|nr:cache domain-containing protein [Oscillospiraceae bacterium]
MTAKERRRKALKRLQQLRIWMIIAYALVVIIALFSVSLFAARKNEDAMKSKVSEMTSSLNTQLKMNLESYLSRMESIATLAFSIEDAYTYDATTSTLDEYDQLNLEKSISDELFKLCLMENFVDYGIVYRDNSKLGKVSNGTLELFGNDMFIDLQAMISRDRTHDGWFAGYKSNYERVYYIKQIHENALLVMSFYTTELEEVFDNPETMHDMAIRLTDRNYKIIYSSENDELGHPLPDDINQAAQSGTSGAILDETNLTTINTCAGGWNIVCSIPTEIILKEEKQTRKSTSIATAVAAFAAALMGTVFSMMLSDPFKMLALSIDEDDEKGRKKS